MGFVIVRIDIYICGEFWVRVLEDGDVVIDFGAVALGDVFSNLYNVAIFLFFEFYKGIEDIKVELV